MIAATSELAAAARCDPPDLKRAETVDKGHGRIEKPHPAREAYAARPRAAIKRLMTA